MAGDIPTRAAVVATSIAPAANPRLTSVVPAALRSFAANGFSVISVNPKEEIERVRSLYPGVAVVAASPRNPIAVGRYGAALGSIFEAAAGCRMLGICNADIVMLGSDIRAALERDPDTFFAAQRLDIDRPGGNILGLYRRGVDAVFFDSGRYAALVEDENLARFQLGAPFWDVVLPIAASFHGPVAFVAPPFIVHVVHKPRVFGADYDILRLWAIETLVRHAERYADDRPAARAFLSLFDTCGGRRSGARDGRDVKNAMMAINVWRTRLERDGRRRIAATIVAEISASALDQLKRPLGETPSDPERALASRMDGAFSPRRVRQAIAAQLRAWRRERSERAAGARLAGLKL